MNIVKGVADLLRRSSGGQVGEGVSWTHAEKHSAPFPRIRFSETREEAILNSLWQRYENTIDKVEKKKSLQVFLLHFIQTYKNWEPQTNDELSAAPSSDDIILGCSSGHPSEVILILVQEITRLTSLVSDLNDIASNAKSDTSDPSSSFTFSADGLYVLNSLLIVNRSMHNCKVFSYYGGVQKVTALLKAAVVQLKTLTSTLSVDEQLSSSIVEKTRFLQKILGFSVLIVFGFMELYCSGNKNVQHLDFTRLTSLRDILPEVSLKNLKDSVSEARIDWRQKAIVLVMEAGGVNWLVELLRVLRKLNLKEHWTDLSLHYLTLGALKLALLDNPRAQNHFRSIGGLEVLLDGIGPPSSKFSDSRRDILCGDDRNYIFGIFQLQVISMEVLRESTFGNMNNLQFLCENGRIHKFANSVCWPAFMLQELQVSFGLAASDPQGVNSQPTKENPDISSVKTASFFDMSNSSTLAEWNRYSVGLSRALCSFLLAPEDIKSNHDEASVKSSMPVSLGYWELSIRWIMKVLLTIFPSIKACSKETELPNHIRAFANIMQQCILCTVRKVLVSAPALLEVFREEGIWDMIFSEKFFYFGLSLDEFDLELDVQIEFNSDAFAVFKTSKDKSKYSNVDILQVEAISFLEFVATLSANTNNLPECSVLIDALEQSARKPDLATIFLRSLQRILQCTPEQSVGSFKSLDAVTRVLKVACIQAQEVRKLNIVLRAEEDAAAEGCGVKQFQTINSFKASNSWVNCMQSAMELFNEYLSIAEHARSWIMRNANCIDCLFDLFWEESLRRCVIEHIIGLFKLRPLLPDDRAARLLLCSKYLETFTRAKEREELFPELSIDLLFNMREIILVDPAYHQTLFRDGECFLHIVSLLNGTFDEEIGEQLVLNVLQTLTLLLYGSSDSKTEFRALVGVGYQTLQSLLLDFCKWKPSERLLNALLDMLVDGKFDVQANALIKNDDVILLFFNILQKSSTSLQHFGLDIFQNLLKDVITNRTSCFRAGVLTFLLDWFGMEENDNLISKISQLIQVIGGHSISGKDIKKIFSLLRNKAIGSKHNSISLLLTSILFMLKEKGPEAFFEFNGNQSGISINTPLQWPHNKGFSFSCWIRVEKFPEHGVMGLFSFLSDSGRGCSAMLGKEKLIFESINQKRHCISLPLNILTRKWYFLCITHNVGRAFSGGSPVRCYVDGDMVSSEKCRYAKVGEALTRCTIGTEYILTIEGSGQINVEKACAFIGQMGPVYMFSDILTSEQIKGIYSLGPSYMYSFLGNEIPLSSDSSLYDGILDAKDGLSSKIIFGLNAQASNGSSLFNVSSLIDSSVDKSLYAARIMDGTQLCSRRMLQEIIYCVGGIVVFLPLLTQFDQYEYVNVQREYILIRIITRDKTAAEVIDLITSVLDGNISNLHQMHRLSGLSILGFLFQSVPPEQLNMENLSALKNLFDVLNTSGISELLKEAISRIYMNPHIWVHASYEVQRDLYMFLIQYFEKEVTLLPILCGLPRIIDIICQFYCDKSNSRSTTGCKALLDSTTKQMFGEKPGQEEVRKIRLLLLSLAEMSLRQRISASDIIALIAFFERSQDMVCIEDVLHMVIRALSQKQLLSSFLEQVILLGGSQLFINLLQRELEPIRLLGLQFLGKLLVGVPSEKKGTKFFSLSVGRVKSVSENLRKGEALTLQPIYSAISERLFAFPLSDHVYATLFDVLLGGASPKQVLQKRNPSENPKSKKHGSTGFSSYFCVPQIVVCVFKYLAECHDIAARTKILGDLIDLLESDLSNAEALMETAWSSWLATSVKLVMFNNIRREAAGQNDTSRINEIVLLRNLYCIVLSHYLFSVKGGWHRLEETVNFLLLNYEQGGVLQTNLLRDILEDLVGSLIEVPSDENIYVLQPCRDNSLYLLKLADELLVSESGDKILFPETSISSNTSSNFQHVENQKYISSAVLEILNPESEDKLPRTRWSYKTISEEGDVIEDDRWVLYDKLWHLIGEMSGRGPSKTLPKNATFSGPTFGQRARGLVESLNIPAAEMASVVVSGGIGTALGAKPSKYVDKAMLLRGEKCPRIVFHLLILYVSKAGLERASRCVQQFISLLPCLLSFDDDQSRNRLHFLIWSLLAVRSQHAMLDDGARFHVISHLILEIVEYGKSILASSILGRDDSLEVTNNTKEAGFILSLIQRDRVLAAAIDEANYIKATKADRIKQLQELHAKIDECSLVEHNQWMTFEEDLTSSMNKIVLSDDSRKASFQLAYDEDQQIVADKWLHMFRTLTDERGPWSAYPFPNNNVTHWKLDKTEDNWRRRPKLKRNYQFAEKLCCTPTNKYSNQPTQQIGDCNSSKGNSFPEQVKHFLLKRANSITEERPVDLPDESVDLNSVNDPSCNCSSESQVSDNVKSENDNTDIVHDRKDLQSVSAEIEPDEVRLSISCVLISPKIKVVGHLLVMQKVLHFTGQFLVEGTGGSSVLNKFSDDGNISYPTKSDLLSRTDKQIQSKGIVRFESNNGKGNVSDVLAADNLLQNKPGGVKLHRRWNISKIKSVHWTRYLLQYTAIEIFFNDSAAPIFLNFVTPKDAKHVGTLVVSLRNESLFPKASSKDRSGIISFVDRRVALEMAETFRECWRRREISNFEYLMLLNTLAGRSYNDLTQYPVFPWVLADYSSEKLDFNKSSTFRDLSKPVGALDSKRFEIFEDRFRNFSDPDIPSFYYGSHYSSMGIVLFYLLRIEPFTTLHRNLQGGKFDHADRLFQSMEGTYRNCLSNTSDVKELIPEFFYMPEFLVNSNSYYFGVKQDGEAIFDVVLPPWAKCSPEEFIYRNREALESEYVSSNLHHWIDLIFGYKQRGKPAVEAANVFYYLTYEGAVDLESMEDALQKSAIEDQIANFGQTPIQIFRKKHPRRGPPVPIAHPLYFAPSSITLTSVISNATNSPSAIIFVGLLEGNVVIVSHGLILSVKLWLTTQLQFGGNYTFSGSQEPFFGIGSDVLPTRKIGTSLANGMEYGIQCLATMQNLNENYLILCGNWENSFQVISVHDGKVVQSIRQHKDLVSCVAVTSDGNILATGSYDTTVMIWHSYRGSSSEKKGRNVNSDLRKDHVIIENPFHILCGHDDIITCLFISLELDIVISGSKDGTCVFHTLRDGRYVRSIQHPSGCSISKLIASLHGRLVIYADNDLSLHMYSVNGKHIASSESNGRLNCIELSCCGDFLVCAGDNGQIVLRSMHSLDVLRRFEGIGKVITSLTVTPEECILAGTKDGSLLLYSVDSPQLRKRNLPRNGK